MLSNSIIVSNSEIGNKPGFRWIFSGILTRYRLPKQENGFFANSRSGRDPRCVGCRRWAGLICRQSIICLSLCILASWEIDPTMANGPGPAP